MMNHWRRSLPALACALALSVSVANCLAQTARDLAVVLSATVQTNPDRISLSWVADAAATNYTVYRKNPQSGQWGAGTSLGAEATSHVDNSVTTGIAYEYHVRKQATNHTGDGYICAGIQVPMTDSRGKLVLVVDESVAPGLALQLHRLELDLAGDGWTVLRRDVSRSASVTEVKALIQGDYNADPAGVKAVFLMGRVPVPYSGNIFPDGHTPDHKGAWPADGYYGEMNGNWTDTTVNYSGSSDPRNRNVPGDGKFDQVDFPSAVELQVGRVDFANLPAIPLSETELLRRYLDKNHAFRQKAVSVPARGLIDDAIGVLTDPQDPSYREGFSTSAWRIFGPFFGPANITGGDWIVTLGSQSYLWGYGCGFGNYTFAGGIANTTQLVTNDTRVVFTMLFGSYFGDWDATNNLMRAQVATSSHTLACAWSGRPYWLLHPMALGETLGAGALLTQNNSDDYEANDIGDALGTWKVHIGLMGDPTLRLHVVTPPSAMLARTGDSPGVELTWTASPEGVLGYQVYRANAAAGPFTRLNSLPVSGTFFNDLTGGPAHVYMVRALKLETSASGSYTNLSQGVFQSLDPVFATPAIQLTEPTNSTLRVLPTALPLRVSVYDPARTITNVSYWANGVKIGETTAPPYSLWWSNPPVGVYSVEARTASVLHGTTNSATVTITIDHGGKPLLAVTLQPDGSRIISGPDPMGRTYTILGAQDLEGNWQTLGTTTAAGGIFQFIDPPPTTNHFYRSRWP